MCCCVNFDIGCMDAPQSGQCSGSHQPGWGLLPYHPKGLGSGRGRHHLPCRTVLWGHCLHCLPPKAGQTGQRHTIVMAGGVCVSVALSLLLIDCCVAGYLLVDIHSQGGIVSLLDVGT